MSRSYSALDLVTLPVLGASSAVVLNTKMLTAASAQAQALSAEDQSLPSGIERARVRLEAANQELSVMTWPQVALSDPQAGRKADRALDRAWSATFDWLSAWSKLPAGSHPSQENVPTLFQLMFPEALSFTKRPFVIQWAESQARIDGVHAAQLEPAIDQLGGKLFYENILSCQKTYGDVLGITAVKSPESSPEVQEKLTAACDALRSYVTKVSAWADPDEPGSEALTRALLAPLVAWEST